MRTELLREAEKKISSINRQVTHALFIGEQFMSDNSSILANSPDQLTSSVYGENPYKDKFNYRLNKVSEVYKEYNSFVLISSFVFSYSVFEIYQEGLLSLIGEIKGSPKSKTLDDLFHYYGSSTATHFSPEERDTMNYIRWRRNCLVHAEGSPNTLLQTMIRSKGRSLNSFWLRTLDVTSINFSSVSVEKITENEFIDLIRILRYFIGKIDSEALSLLSQNDVVVFSLSEFKTRFAKKIKNRNKSRIETMFLNFIQRKFDIHKEDLDFENINFGDVA
ncbi:MAG: hypothetical protein OT477_21315 [Chloroflexi bacterium]|nr:hypothetical protein [Chloroflexota bacterium]